MDVSVDCINILQYVVQVCACGVVNKEYIIYIPGVKGQDLGVEEGFDDGFFKML